MAGGSPPARFGSVADQAERTAKDNLELESVLNRVHAPDLQLIQGAAHVDPFEKLPVERGPEPRAEGFDPIAERQARPGLQHREKPAVE